VRDPVSKEELRTALRESANRTVELLVHEMGVRFAEVNQRLDRVRAELAELKLRVANLGSENGKP
jgi:hypothetical protein